jgi:hypothetical protein
MQDIDWRPIPAFEGLYEINKLGEIRSLNKRYRDNNLKTRIDRGGYLTVRLSKQNTTSSFFVHRLLALAFILKPEGKEYINHKNGNKVDNRISNLEWVTHQENVIDAYKKGLNSSAKSIIDMTSGIIYYSISEASRCLGINYNTCCKRLKRNLDSFRLRYAR